MTVTTQRTADRGGSSTASSSRTLTPMCTVAPWIPCSAVSMGMSLAGKNPTCSTYNAAHSSVGGRVSTRGGVCTVRTQDGGGGAEGRGKPGKRKAREGDGDAGAAWCTHGFLRAGHEHRPTRDVVVHVKRRPSRRLTRGRRHKRSPANDVAVEGCKHVALLPHDWARDTRAAVHKLNDGERVGTGRGGSRE